MSIDRTTSGPDDAESIQEKPPLERRAPPPDRPGEQDRPSRADSRRGAAAANRTDARPAETMSDREQRETVAGSRSQAPGIPQQGAEESSGSSESASEDTAAVSAQLDIRAPSIDDAGRPDARLASKAGADVAGKSEEAIEKPAEATYKADPAAADGSKSRETGLASRPPMGLLVDGKPIREVLDPVGADAWLHEIGDVVDDRSGDQIADAENDKESRFERLRKKGFEKGDDALDVAEKATNQAHDLLTKHPPTGHSETPTGPAVSDAPHVGLDPGNVVTAAILAGMLAGDGIRWFHSKLKTRERIEDAGDR